MARGSGRTADSTNVRTGQPGAFLRTDIRLVSPPTRPIASPTNAEMGLVMAAKYESELLIHAAQARRRFHTLGILSAIAALVLAYDAVSLVLGR